jgi:malonyl-CoA O-methyltransferase
MGVFNNYMKQRIIEAFDKASQTYEKAADFQRFAAHRLALSLPELKTETPRILEIGAGTGFVTSFLPLRYPQAVLEITDPAPEMLLRCQCVMEESFPNHPMRFFPLDGENLEETLTGQYDLIVSGLTVQWFQDPLTAFGAIRKYLSDEGIFMFSTLSDHTFKEWRGLLKGEGYDLKMAHISREQLNQVTGLTYDSFQIIEDYQTGEAFLKHLKDIGANTTVDTQKPPSSLIRRVLKQFDGKVTYDLVIGKIF